MCDLSEVIWLRMGQSGDGVKEEQLLPLVF